MLLQIFSIRDSKGEVYMQPFFQKTPGEAERSFKSLVNDQTPSNVSKYPEDFDLFKIGHFDDSTGKITALETPIHICKALHLRNAQVSNTPPELRPV